MLYLGLHKFHSFNYQSMRRKLKFISCILLNARNPNFQYIHQLMFWIIALFLNFLKIFSLESFRCLKEYQTIVKQFLEQKNIDFI